MLKRLMGICRWNFGEFQEDEFKKFLRMGLIFALILGSYWTLRPLKDALFIKLVGEMYLPYAKTCSVIALLPIVIGYTSWLARVSREQMLFILPSIYGVVICFFSIGIWYAHAMDPNAGQGLPSHLYTQILGYMWYICVESFGSLVLALFWAFATDTTDPHSAKRGFPLVVAIGQSGGIVVPYCIVSIPHYLGLSTDTLAMVLVSGLIFAIIPGVRYFLAHTPVHLLASFDGSHGPAPETPKKEEPGFMEGLEALRSHRYMMGIFAIIFMYEVIVTIFDFNFKMAAAQVYKGVALTKYLGSYAASVNVLALLGLLLGVSNIPRFFGVRVTLLVMPLWLACALVIFLTTHELHILFGLMVTSKAIHYALNNPSIKQLYIPTTTSVRFKTQAWIESFGTRAAKEGGSIFNMLLGPLQHIWGPVAGKMYYVVLSGFLCFPLVALWLVMALYVGKTFKVAIDEKRFIC